MLAMVVVGLVVALFVLFARLQSLQQRVAWLEQASDWGRVAPSDAQPDEPYDAHYDDGAPPKPEPQPERVLAASYEAPPEVFDKPIEEPVKVPTSDWRDRFSIEDIFGRRLPIWAGGITLAIAGLLIVKYSIDAGLLSPSVRVAGGLLFGLVLIAAAELAYRFEARVGDERVRQALAGAGIATLYGAVLVAANVYGLIGNGPAFLGMAAITALALGLSLRFGAPSAMLGLAGGLAAPALVGSDNPSIPLLTAYLALTIGALGFVSRRQEWLWLRAAALAGGFGWTAFLVASGTLDQAGGVTVGLLMLTIGFVFPTLRRGGADDRIQWLTGVMAAAQVAALVASGGFTLLHWGLFGLLSAATLWLSARSPAHARLPAVGLVVVIMLMAAWPTPPAAHFALVMAGAVALYGGWAFRRLWGPDGSMVEAGALAALGLGAMGLPYLQFDGAASLALLGGVGVLASLIPGLAAWAGWNHADRGDDPRFATLVTANAGALAGAALIGLEGWALAPAFVALALALERVLAASHDSRLRGLVIVAGIASALSLFAGDNAQDEWVRLAGETADASAFAALRFGLVACVLAWLVRAHVPRQWKAAFQAGAALTAYGALAQVVGGQPLSTVAALMTVVLAALGARKILRHWRTAAATTLGILGLWLIEPLGAWLATAVNSLEGHPFLAGPFDGQTLVWRLALPAVLLAVALQQAAHRMPAALRRAIAITIAAAATVSAHLLFKQVFAINTLARFVDDGVAERALWETLLLAGAVLPLRLGQRRAALVLTGASLLHALVYTMLWHNPLWAAQSVRTLPVLNLLLIAYAPPLAALWLLGRVGLDHPLAERVRSLAPALPIALLAFSLVRQAVEGPILANPGVTPAEDIARSMVAVLLGIGFLLWGIARQARDWRILSLAVMVAAVGKVFLLDAAGLDGLARIGSFLALGLSLIGIGWLYSRFLRSDDNRVPAA